MGDDLLKTIFGPKVPLAVLLPVAVLLFWGRLKPAVLDVAHVLRWAWRVRKVGLKQSREDVERAKRRAAFARHVRRQVLDLGERQGFVDDRFADIELTVTAGDDDDWPWWRRGFSRGPRRESSLAAALEHSDDAARLLLLQGEPGGGKSVALRHLTAVMAGRAAEKPRLGAVIPIYVDLSGLQPDGNQVGPRLIEAFVFHTLRSNQPEMLAKILDEEKEWELGLADGTWLFLFDSFDEIPAVLTATEAEEGVVRDYLDAVAAYVDGPHGCRGILGSRTFRNPKSSRWPVLGMQRLSARRQRDLIGRSGLSQQAKQTILSDLPGAPADVQAMAATPLFLALLCDYVDVSGRLPDSVSDTFEEYVQRRLDRDAERVHRRYGVTQDTLWSTAERVAFAMSAVDGLGLKPRRSALLAGLSSLKFAVTDQTVAAMNALEETRLAGSDDDGPSSDPTFRFTGHRRIQEYFATRLVKREPWRVPAQTLLTDQKWRETAVALLQTGSDATDPVLKTAASLLDDMLLEMETPDGRFSWPPRAEHLLDILQAGFAQRPQQISPEVTQRTDRLLRRAFEPDAGKPDQRWALGVLGAASPATGAELLQTAFATGSEWLKEAAYRQVALLREIPPEIARSIRLTLLTMLANGRLAEDAATVEAQLRQLERPDLMRAFRVLRVLPKVDLAVHVAVAAAVTLLVARTANGVALIGAILLGAGLLSAFGFGLIVTLIADILGRAPSGGSETGASGEPRPGARSYLNVLSNLVLPARAIFTLITLEATVLRPALPVGLAAGVLLILVITWAPAALFAVATRPALTTRELLLCQFPIVRDVVAGIRPRHVAVVVGVLGGAAVLGWLLVLFVEHSPAFVLIALAVLVALGTVAMYVWIIRDFNRTTLSDIRWHRRWKPGGEGSLDLKGFLRALGEQRTGRGAKRLVTKTRKRRLLPAEDDSVVFVSDLIRVLDSPLRAKGIDPDGPLQSWLAEDSHLGALRRHGTPLLDELGPLLEALRARRDEQRE